MVQIVQKEPESSRRVRRPPGHADLTDAIAAVTLTPSRFVRRKEVDRESDCSWRSPEPLRSSRLARSRP